MGGSARHLKRAQKKRVQNACKTSCQKGHPLISYTGRICPACYLLYHIEAFEKELNHCQEVLSRRPNRVDR